MRGAKGHSQPPPGLTGYLLYSAWEGQHPSPGTGPGGRQPPPALPARPPSSSPLPRADTSASPRRAVGSDGLCKGSPNPPAPALSLQLLLGCPSPSRSGPTHPLNDPLGHGADQEPAPRLAAERCPGTRGLSPGARLPAAPIPGKRRGEGSLLSAGPAVPVPGAPLLPRAGVHRAGQSPLLPLPAPRPAEQGKAKARPARASDVRFLPRQPGAGARRCLRPRGGSAAAQRLPVPAPPRAVGPWPRGQRGSLAMGMAPWL